MDSRAGSRANGRGASIAVAARDSLVRALGPPGEWKVLVWDRFAMEVMSPVLKRGDLESAGVTLRLPLERKREPMPQVDATVVLEPTAEGLATVARDVQAGCYARFRIVALHATPTALLEQFAKDCGAGSARVVSYQDRLCGFAAFDDRTASLNLPGAFLLLNSPGMDEGTMEGLATRICDGAVDVAATWAATLAATSSRRAGVAPTTTSKKPAVTLAHAGGAAAHVAAMLQGRLAELHRSLNVGNALAAVLLMDRDEDLVGALRHSWSYGSLLHDLLGLRLGAVDGAEVRAATGKADAANAKATVATYDVSVLHDPFYAKHSCEPFPEVAAAVHAEIEDFDSKRRAGAEGGGTQALQETFSALGEMRERKRLIDLHTALASAVVATVKSRGIDALVEWETNVLGSGVEAASAALESELERLASEDVTRCCLLLKVQYGSKYSPSKLALEKAASDELPHALAFLDYLHGVKGISGAAFHGAGLPDAAGFSGGDALSAIFSGAAKQLKLSESLLLQGLKGIRQLGFADSPQSRVLERARALLSQHCERAGPLAAGSGVLVFVVGGGSASEAEAFSGANLVPAACSHSGSGADHPTLYCATDLVRPRDFVGELAELGRQLR